MLIGINFCVYIAVHAKICKNNIHCWGLIGKPYVNVSCHPSHKNLSFFGFFPYTGEWMILKHFKMIHSLQTASNYFSKKCNGSQWHGFFINITHICVYTVNNIIAYTVFKYKTATAQYKSPTGTYQNIKNINNSLILRGDYSPTLGGGVRLERLEGVVLFLIWIVLHIHRS